MSRRARASGVAGENKTRRGLWSLIRRMFGAPEGRHVIGAPPPPTASPAPAVTAAPAASPPPEPRTPVVSQIVTSAVQASPPDVPTTTGLASIRLIFTDGTVVPLPEGSVEGRRAQYLARRVLEAGRRS